MNRLHRRLKPA